MRENKKHLIDWDGRTFLEVEKDWRRRRIKEALYIDSINPQEDIDPNKLMNPEKGTSIEMLETILPKHSRNFQRKDFSNKTNSLRKEYL